ncbi:hypothetical protein HYPSUDRAFT_286271 [Hypholoma sublateritium FD-334 SS-4]|uniref:Uncharacterized protein n=1 Tax=Hypholoma sublateritium (strain FD-334 SS-4) TaxID=945553 RepID=A0A0D2P8A6_HYPSF|nr:hypothetical protein HYPSUDRAFT_286271 [Hypholoma sublateritium FD-334 SS-4]
MPSALPLSQLMPPLPSLAEDAQTDSARFVQVKLYVPLLSFLSAADSTQLWRRCPQVNAAGYVPNHAPGSSSSPRSTCDFLAGIAILPTNLHHLETSGIYLVK